MIEFRWWFTIRSDEAWRSATWAEEWRSLQILMQFKCKDEDECQSRQKIQLHPNDDWEFTLHRQMYCNTRRFSRRLHYVFIIQLMKTIDNIDSIMHIVSWYCSTMTNTTHSSEEAKVMDIIPFPYTIRSSFSEHSISHIFPIIRLTMRLWNANVTPRASNSFMEEKNENETRHDNKWQFINPIAAHSKASRSRKSDTLLHRRRKLRGKIMRNKIALLSLEKSCVGWTRWTFSFSFYIQLTRAFD